MSATGDLFASVGSPLSSSGIAVDPTLYFDYTIVLNAPALAEGFERCAASVQVKAGAVLPSSSSGRAFETKKGVTFAELLVPVVRVHVSKFSATPRGRPLVLLTKVTFFSLAVNDANDAAELTERAELWANVAFDRFDKVSGKMRNVRYDGHAGTVAAAASSVTGDGLASAAGSSSRVGGASSTATTPTAAARFESDAHLLRSALLANKMPEYYRSRMLFVVVPGLGTASVPVEKCGNGETVLTADVCLHGVKVGSFEMTLLSQCSRTWRPKYGLYAFQMSVE
jgi:hypothetical protein